MITWLIHNSLFAGVLALSVWTWCRWRKCSPAVQHALWLVVLVRLLLPPGILDWPWTIPWPAHDTTAVAIVELPVQTPVDSTSVTEIVELPVVTPALFESDVALATAPRSPIDWLALSLKCLAAVWVVGLVWVIVRHMRALLQVRRLIRSGTAADPNVVLRTREMSNRLGITAPRTLAIPGLASPMVAGFLRPVLLWPTHLENRLSPEGVNAVVMHELAHLKRRDHWLRWLELPLSCIWWWHPVFRVARRRIHQSAELACDAWVLNVLPRARRAYAEALLHVCERVSGQAAAAPAIGIGGDHRDLESRLTHIMRGSAACRMAPSAMLFIGVVLCLTMPSWSIGVSRSTHADDAKPAGAVSPDAPTNQPVPPNDDHRLEELHRKIQALLEEVRALKNAPTEQDATRTKAASESAVADALRYLRSRNTQPAIRKPGTTQTGETHARYLLSRDQGEALARFLRAHAADRMRECAVDKDGITVTATGDVQRAVAGLVRLMQAGVAK